MDNTGNYPGGSAPYNASSSNKKLQQTQAQVDEVVGIMRLNVEKVLERDQKLTELAEHAGINAIGVVGIMRSNVAKVLERDEKLSELGHRADNLQVGASQFEQQASRLKRKYWWKNLKMMIIIGVICAVLLIIILVSIFSPSGSGDGGSSGSSGDKAAIPSPSVNPATQAPN